MKKSIQFLLFILLLSPLMAIGSEHESNLKEPLENALAKLPKLSGMLKPLGCKIDANWKANQYLQPCHHSKQDGRRVSFIKFSLPEDRDAFLNNKDVMEGLGKLARNAAIRQASKAQVQKGLSPKVKVKDVHLYEEYLIFSPYIELRLTWDEPAEGYLVVESNASTSAFAGFILATPFATWEPAFDFNSAKTSVSPDLMDAITQLAPERVSVPETETFDHKIYKHICELSLLIGYGNGKDLMHRLALDIKESEEFTVLMTNALPSAIPFYENILHMESIPVHRWELRGFPETRSISIAKRPYYHYLYAGESLMEEERAHMYAIEIDQIDMGLFTDSKRKGLESGEDHEEFTHHAKKLRTQG